MDITQLKNRLLKEGYADNIVTEATAKRLMSLKGNAAKMLREWFEYGHIPSFECIDGVDSKFLCEKLHMKAPAVIIAYAMLEDSPVENAKYFKHLSNNIIGFYPVLK